MDTCIMPSSRISHAFGICIYMIMYLCVYMFICVIVDNLYIGFYDDIDRHWYLRGDSVG